MSLERFEEELRKAAPGDAPSADRRAANRAALLAAAGLAAPLAAAPAPAALATKTALIVKLTLVSALAVGVGAAVVMTTRAPARPPVSIVADAGPTNLGDPTPPASSAATAPTAPDAPAPEAEPSVARTTVASAQPPVEVRRSLPSASSTPDPLALEASLLEAARTCLNAHDLACTTSQLATYDSRFPRGALADEATLLHIDAARAAGNGAEARHLAQQLLAAHPTRNVCKTRPRDTHGARSPVAVLRRMDLA